jgi:ubiquinone/menaquinone biosynthesis C-methylase UbiE
MSVWGRIFAAMYDPMMAGSEKAGLADHRRDLLANARGRVLEIGAGTGANLPYYTPAVEEVVLAEPEEPMARRLDGKLDSARVSARVVRASADALPFEDDAFDTVVSTLVLCTVPDQRAALAEIQRVLKSDGRLLFLEHVRADNPKLARWQDRVNGFNRRLGHGCNCNRDTVAAIESAGFALDTLERDRFPKAPPTSRPLVIGTANTPR